MKYISTILVFVLSLSGIGQSNGYVLQNSNGTIRIPDSSITTDKIAGLLSLLGAKQNLNTKLTSISSLNNGSGYLKNDGNGVFSYDNPAGAGTVTSVSVVNANGVSGSVATATSTPAITIALGAITPTTVNGVTITDLLPKTTTAGVAASPTASGTVTITHNLGRTPNIIEIYSISSFTSNAAATPVPFSMGTFNSTGNRCLYMVINGTTTQVSQTSTVFSIIMVTSAGNRIEGVIGNVGATTFDIVFTETGTHTAGNYLWKAQ